MTNLIPESAFVASGSPESTSASPLDKRRFRPDSLGWLPPREAIRHRGTVGPRRGVVSMGIQYGLGSGSDVMIGGRDRRSCAAWGSGGEDLKGMRGG